MTTPTSNRCCSKCLGVQFHVDEGGPTSAKEYCRNPQCECHVKLAVVTSGRTDYCVTCDSEHGFDCPKVAPHTTEKNSGWRERLNELAKEERKNAFEKHYAGFWFTFNAHNIEAFIATVEKEAEERGYKLGWIAKAKKDEQEILSFKTTTRAQIISTLKKFVEGMKWIECESGHKDRPVKYCDACVDKATHNAALQTILTELERLAQEQ